jgi:hypothetical protein
MEIQMAKMEAFLRRPVIGPIILGIFGGIPFGIVFTRLSGRAVSPNFLLFMLILTPPAVILATISALSGASKRWPVLMARALLTSIFACVPFPTVVWLLEIFHDLGIEGILTPGTIPTVAVLIAVWTATVAVFAWFFAVMFEFMKRPRINSAI